MGAIIQLDALIFDGIRVYKANAYIHKERTHG
jgi:hypothetical protein